MTLEEMRARKRELGLTNERLAELSNVPLGTVQKVFAGVTKAPRVQTILALEHALNSMTVFTYPRTTGEPPVMYLHESLPLYNAASQKGPGDYTLSDYYALPDDRRAELIDGRIYDMPAPSRAHQMVLGQLFLRFTECIERHEGCELYFAPLDVRLDRDNRTMLQPDLLIICNDRSQNQRYIDGAPDFVLEVLSPSNPGHDMIRKLNKYWNAGVREYWVVDPMERNVHVWFFEESVESKAYSFTGSVPVAISKGECVINFSGINEKLNQMKCEP